MQSVKRPWRLWDTSHLKIFCASVLFAGLLVGCGGDPSNNNFASDTTDESRELENQTQLKGSATKGRMAFATVRVSRYEGSSWQLLGETETDAQGNYEINLARENVQGLIQVTITPRDSGTSMMACDWPAGCGAYPAGFVYRSDLNSNGKVDFGEWRPMPPGFTLNAWVSVPEPVEALNAHVSVITHFVAKAAADMGASEQALMAANTSVAEALGLRGVLTDMQPVGPDQLLNDESMVSNVPSVDAVMYGAINAAVVGSFGSFENFLNALSADLEDFNLRGQGIQESAASVSIEALMTQARNVLKALANVPEGLQALVSEAETLLLAGDGTATDAVDDVTEEVADDVPNDDTHNNSNDDSGTETGSDTDTGARPDTDAEPPVVVDSVPEQPLTDVERAKAFLRQMREMVSLGQSQLPVWKAQLEALSTELSVTASVVEPELLAALAAMQEIVALGQAIAQTQDLEAPFSETVSDLTFASEGAQRSTETGQFRSDAQKHNIEVMVTGSASNGVKVNLVLVVNAQAEMISEGAPEWHESNEVSDHVLATGLAGTMVSGETTISIAQTLNAGGIMHRHNYRQLPRSSGVIVDAELIIDLALRVQREGQNRVDFTGRVLAEWVIDQYQFAQDFLTREYRLMPLNYGLGEPWVAYLDALKIEGAIVGQNTEQGLAFSVAMTDVQAFYEIYENYMIDASRAYDSVQRALEFQGHIKAQVGFKPSDEEWVSVSLAGGAEVVYNYLAHNYRGQAQGQPGSESVIQENLTRLFVPEGVTVGLDLNDNAFNLEIVDKTQVSVDRFCGGDASLWQLTNQDNVSLMFNISEQCNFGKISLVGGTLKTLGTLEKRDNLWIIQFVDGTFETLF